MIAISVIVPTRDNIDELERCLLALSEQTVRPTRILVCVDGSTDGTVERLRTKTPSASVPTIVLTHASNAHRGRAATRNLALDEIRGDYVWLLDSDMVPVPEALERHLEIAEPGAVSVGAVDYANADESIWAGYLDTRGRHRYAHRASLPFTQFTTANSVVPAVALRDVNGFDSSFAAYGGEDIDLALRLQEDAGLLFMNNARAIARTIEEKPIDAAMARFETYGATNLHLLEQKHPAAPRTFELHRLGSPSWRDRLFVASLNPLSDALASTLVRTGPSGLRRLALNYMVIRSVWRGYRRGSRGR